MRARQKGVQMTVAELITKLLSMPQNIPISLEYGKFITEVIEDDEPAAVYFIAAQESGTNAAHASNSQSDAITLWKMAVACWENNGDMNDFYLGNEKKINVVVA